MGTNYYLHKKDEKPHCENCSCYQPLHIGKSSAGWCFALHVTDEIKSLEDWKVRWQEGEIRDEYGTVIDAATMLDTITNRKWHLRTTPHGYASWDHFHADNHSVNGPNGLVRHKINPRHCIGHGDGPWDLCVGEFS